MAAKKQKKRSKQSLKEFQAWLTGVEEMQDSDWVPSLEQWKLIRSRIDNIIEPTPVESKPIRQYTASGGQMIPTMPEMSTSFDSVLVPELTGDVPRAPKVAQSPPSVGTTHTPDIDSTTGYKSGFA